MRRRQAFSLGEVMLALLVMAVAYIPLAELYRLTTAQTIKSRNVLLAQHMAQNVFEVYRMRCNDLLFVLSGTTTLTTADLLADQGWKDRLTGKAPEVEGVLKMADFKIAVTVKSADQNVFGLDHVELEMTWKEGGHEHERTFARLISR